jgi:hypothetical protein
MFAIFACLIFKHLAERASDGDDEAFKRSSRASRLISGPTECQRWRNQKLRLLNSRAATRQQLIDIKHC